MREPLVKTAPPTTRVNVTPIIDVALVLVIILLVTAPMLSQADLEVELPGAHSRGIEEHEFISVTVDLDGRVAVDKTVLGGIGDLAGCLHGELKAYGDEPPLVVVRADAGLPHEVVRQVLTAVREGGARRMGVASRQTGRSGS
jgi:biopolymer transport protein ExbD